MGNKVIAIGSHAGELSALEVYRDVGMVSKPAGQYNGRVKYAVSRLVNMKAIQNSLYQIFHWIPGERVLLPEFGSRLYMLLYQGITPETEEAIVAEIQHSVSEWEPRVRISKVVNISTVNDTENNTIKLEIWYTVPSLSDEQFKYTYSVDGYRSRRLRYNIGDATGEIIGGVEHIGDATGEIIGGVEHIGDATGEIIGGISDTNDINDILNQPVLTW